GTHQQRGQRRAQGERAAPQDRRAWRQAGRRHAGGIRRLPGGRARALEARRRACRRQGGLMSRPAFIASLVALLVASPAPAQEWPAATVRIVVPYAAGGPVDFPARLIIDRLAAQTKGVFILENRPGAGGSIGLQTVVQAPADGATFLLTTSSV